MSRILLADDSPHAQRMGERILREEGFEVVSLTDGNAALMRMADVDPDVILADVFLPGKSGLDLCRFVKNDVRFKHVRVVLTAGLLEPFDEEEAKLAGCDGILKKPFEASRVLSTINPLVKDAQVARTQPAEAAAVSEGPPTITIERPVIELPLTLDPIPTAEAIAPDKLIVEIPHAVEPAPQPVQAAAATEPAPNAAMEAAPEVTQEIDAERVRAAVTVALDAALPAMIQEITERVLIALGH